MQQKPEGRRNLEDKVSNLQVTEVTGDRALVAGTNTLCGAIATLWRGIQKLVKGARCSIVEAIEAATLHPAQVSEKKLDY